MAASKYYFASDFHLGLDLAISSKEREARLVRWLKTISADAAAVYLVGDLFEFWFEYKSVVPVGYNRFLGQLAEMRDQGIPIFIFTGNHDMWMFNFFERELDIPVYKKPLEIELLGKKFHIGHGDGIGPGDHGYKFIKAVFANGFFQFLYRQLHPNFAFGLAHFFSGQSRKAQNHDIRTPNWATERQVIFAAAHARQHTDIDYYVFGHRHIPMQVDLGSAQMFNLGDWMQHFSYGVYDGKQFSIHFFENEQGKLFEHKV